jgi:dihydroorotase
MTQQETGYDTLIVGGRVMDPANGFDGVADVAVSDGRIVAVEAGLAGRTTATKVIDATGSYVLPGLVEGHTHIFESVSKVGAPAVEAHLRRGVVAAADAGTAGASTFPAFRRLVVEPNPMRILSFLNVSVLGLIDFRFGELLNPATFSVEDALQVAAENADVVRGFKIRLSEDVLGDQITPLLKKAVDLAERGGLPLMVHIGETALSVPEIVDMLRPGDIIAHCYTGKAPTILGDDGRVQDEIYAARERGVLYESAHGRSNLSFKVAAVAIEQGFIPDVITSDTSARNWNGPVFDLVTSMSKLIALGIPLEEVVPRVTIEPARLLGIDGEGFGALTVGGPAHVTVLADAGIATLPDAAGNTIEALRLEPTAVLLHGEQYDLVPWRGLSS